MSRAAVDHITLSVADYPKAKAFYTKALKPLGWSLIMEFPEKGAPSYGGFGVDGKPFLWIAGGKRQTPPTHTAFGANSRSEVDAFYKTALAAGAKDNGPPGVRKMYHPNYYAAFVFDPEGHNIEAVFHGAVAAPKKAADKNAKAGSSKKTAAKKKPAAKVRKKAR